MVHVTIRIYGSDYIICLSSSSASIYVPVYSILYVLIHRPYIRSQESVVRSYVYVVNKTYLSTPIILQPASRHVVTLPYH